MANNTCFFFKTSRSSEVFWFTDELLLVLNLTVSYHWIYNNSRLRSEENAILKVKLICNEVSKLGQRKFFFLKNNYSPKFQTITYLCICLLINLYLIFFHLKNAKRTNIVMKLKPRRLRDPRNFQRTCLWLRTWA